MTKNVILPALTLDKTEVMDYAVQASKLRTNIRTSRYDTAFAVQGPGFRWRGPFAFDGRSCGVGHLLPKSSAGIAAPWRCLQYVVSRHLYEGLKCVYSCGPVSQGEPPLAHPHSLKHSIARHSIKNGVGIEGLKTYLGHKTLSSTGMYLRIDDTEASAAIVAALTT